jgi:hypothetical protein
MIVKRENFKIQCTNELFLEVIYQASAWNEMIPFDSISLMGCSSIEKHPMG